MSFKKWLPSYLWFSGVLFQALFVTFAIHSLLAAWPSRPAHIFHDQIFQKLSELEFCNSSLSDSDFRWEGAKEFQVQLSAKNAEIVSLRYRNRGSVGRTSQGDHVYRVQFEASIKDLSDGAVVRFPPGHEGLLQVNRNNRVVSCYSQENAANLQVDKLHQVRRQPCEKPGWSRRWLCDQDSERCYPMSLCSRGSK